MHEDGAMTRTMMQGDITFLYKKGDPREMRNYRPITLLNVDWHADVHEDGYMHT